MRPPVKTLKKEKNKQRKKITQLKNHKLQFLVFFKKQAQESETGKRQ